MRSRRVLCGVPRGHATTDLPAVPRGHPVRRTARSASRAAGTAGCGRSSAGSRGCTGSQYLSCIACALLGRLNWPFGAYDLVETRLNWAPGRKMLSACLHVRLSAVSMSFAIAYRTFDDGLLLTPGPPTRFESACLYIGWCGLLPFPDFSVTLLVFLNV